MPGVLVSWAPPGNEGAVAAKPRCLGTAAPVWLSGGPGGGGAGTPSPATHLGTYIFKGKASHCAASAHVTASFSTSPPPPPPWLLSPTSRPAPGSGRRGGVRGGVS